MMKKMSTQLENQVDWLKSEIEKDKIELDREKNRFIQQIKKINKEELLPKPVEVKKLTLWQKILKVITKS
jgi:hypothetical protein